MKRGRSSNGLPWRALHFLQYSLELRFQAVNLISFKSLLIAVEEVKRTARMVDNSIFADPRTMPIKINWPFDCRAGIPASIKGITPVVSNIMFRPWGTIARIAAVRSAGPEARVEVSMMCVAPSCLARSRRDGTLSTPMIVLTPRIFAAWGGGLGREGFVLEVKALRATNSPLLPTFQRHRGRTPVNLCQCCRVSRYRIRYSQQ